MVLEWMEISAPLLCAVLNWTKCDGSRSNWTNDPEASDTASIAKQQKQQKGKPPSPSAEVLEYLTEKNVSE